MGGGRERETVGRLATEMEGDRKQTHTWYGHGALVVQDTEARLWVAEGLAMVRWVVGGVFAEELSQFEFGSAQSRQRLRAVPSGALKGIDYLRGVGHMVIVGCHVGCGGCCNVLADVCTEGQRRTVLRCCNRGTEVGAVVR